MKKVYHIILSISIASLIISCTSGKADQIKGKWLIDKILNGEETVVDLEKSSKCFSTSKEDMLISLGKSFVNIGIEFKDDNKYIFHGGSYLPEMIMTDEYKIFDLEGEYEVDEEKSTIEIHAESIGKSTILSIEKLTDTYLWITIPTVDITFQFIKDEE